ncbi:BQ2448_7276 [Microbotryum intermedium]|uniref:BQ2448_7276 protein n=1 Tax=Microbotryum intermedium TaxID=269621 RepID=A0A238FHQ5_9BASI|nr:BQ2448_7276 [Microbotryum intermedium]
MERHFARAAVEIVTDSSADQSLATASKSPYMTRAGGATPRLGFQFRMGKQADSSATLINLTQVADFAYIPTSPDESSYRRPRSNRRPILSWRRIGHLGGSGSAALLLVTIVVLSCVIIHLKRRDAQSFIEELHTTGDSLWAAMPDPLAAMLDRGEGAIASKLTDTSAAGVANVDAGLDKENRRPSKLHYFTHATPQEKFWDQLRPGRRYLTAFTFGGHSNQMLGIQKLLYLAKVTSRVPIVPTMIPDHFAGFPADFTKFYDLDRFYRETGIPAFVMSGIKPGDNNWQSQPIEEIAREHLGCWSVQEAVVGYANGFGHTLVHHNFGVNLWALPELTKAIGGNEIAFDAMRMFDFDKLARSTWLDKVKREMLPQKETEAILPITDSEGRANNTKDTFNPVSGVLPNDKVLCFDNTMFLGAIEFSEEEEVEQGRSVPQPEPRLTGEDITWQEVGQHIFFNTEVREMASKYLVHLFEVASPAEMPPYISVHLRRGDFAAFAGGYTKLEGYLMGIKRIQAKLQSRIDDLQSWQSPGKRHFKPRSGSKVIDFPIVATTDEDMGSDLVRQIRGLGWKVVDHDAMQTIETKGPWWLTVLDMAILAGGSGFIGTERSTYSYMTGLRVKYWQGGVVDFAGDNLQAVDLKALLREYEDREAAKEAKAMAKALQP